MIFLRGIYNIDVCNLFIFNFICITKIYNFLLIIRFETISTKKLPKMYYKIMSLKILKYSNYKKFNFKL